MPRLVQTGFEEMQNYLRVLRIVLIPGVVHCLAGAGQRQGRNQAQVETLAMKEVGQRSMLVAVCLEPDQSPSAELAQIHAQPLILRQRVGKPKAPPSSRWRWL